jgi:inositol phosphorylceramide mannosyltransferase catalytic subunit
MTQKIPKRIIQIYCPPEGRGDELPLFNRCALQNLKLLHPDFDFLLFDRTSMRNFIRDEFPEFQAVMEAFSRPIQQFDFFRYLAVYRLGGFYFDLDVFLARGLHPLLESECVFSFEELTISEYLRKHHRVDWELANYGFGAAPGNRFIGKVIENCVRGMKDRRWAAQLMSGIPSAFRDSFMVPMTTGPGMVSLTFAENPDLRKSVTVLFPDDVCDETSWQRFGEFGVHLMQSSWRERQGFLRSFLARKWEKQKRQKYLLESQASGPKRRGEWLAWPTESDSAEMKPCLGAAS